MKPEYGEVVRRFLADQGGLYRFYQMRWWHLDDGYWTRDEGRGALEQDLINWMYGYAPGPQEKMTIADMNHMCALLARTLTTSRLPGRYIDVDQDPKIRHRYLIKASPRSSEPQAPPDPGSPDPPSEPRPRPEDPSQVVEDPTGTAWTGGHTP